MDNSNLVEVTMETVNTVIFRAISEIRGNPKRLDETRNYNFLKNFLDDSGVSDDSFLEKMKTLASLQDTIFILTHFSPVSHIYTP